MSKIFIIHILFPVKRRLFVINLRAGQVSASWSFRSRCYHRRAGTEIHFFLADLVMTLLLLLPPCVMSSVDPWVVFATCPAECLPLLLPSLKAGCHFRRIPPSPSSPPSWTLSGETHRSKPNELCVIPPSLPLVVTHPTWVVHSRGQQEGGLCSILGPLGLISRRFHV